MTHPRRIIRQSVAAAIIAANTALADRVWASREAPVAVEPVLIEQGAVCLIYTRKDRSPEKDGHSVMGEGWVKRECDLFVEITAAGAFIVDDKLDDLAEVVEGIMDDFAVPGLPAVEIRHVETEIDTTDVFEQPIGGALLQYTATYYREWRAPPVSEWPFPPSVDVIANGDPPEPVQLPSCEADLWA